MQSVSPYHNPISQTLANFNNPNVNGKIYGVYITTNESNLAATNKLLKEHPLPSSQTIHIGCATWHNFDIMCARKSTYGLILDFNPKNAEFIKKTIDLIRISGNRHVFIQNMAGFLNSLQGSERDLFFHSDQRGLPTDRIKQELSREGSWLCSDANYQFMQSLVGIPKTLSLVSRLVAITESITNYETCFNIRKFLDSNHIAIDSLYLGNICDFKQSKRDKYCFELSVKHLLNPDTIFINCPKLVHQSTNQQTILQQKTMLGKDVLSPSFDPQQLFEIVI